MILSRSLEVFFRSCELLRSNSHPDQGSIRNIGVSKKGLSRLRIRCFMPLPEASLCMRLKTRLLDPGSHVVRSGSDKVIYEPVLTVAWLRIRYCRYSRYWTRYVWYQSCMVRLRVRTTQYVLRTTYHCSGEKLLNA